MEFGSTCACMAEETGSARDERVSNVHAAESGHSRLSPFGYARILT